MRKMNRIRIIYNIIRFPILSDGKRSKRLFGTDVHKSTFNIFSRFHVSTIS